MKPGTKSTLLAGDRVASDEILRFDGVDVIIRAGLLGEELTRAGLWGVGLLLGDISNPNDLAIFSRLTYNFLFLTFLSVWIPIGWWVLSGGSYYIPMSKDYFNGAYY